MQITVNHQPMAVEPPISVEALLQQLNHLEKGVALAVNSKIISRSRWASYLLSDGDNITLIKATAGG
ncbi:sulfur carrier protein ThiS [Endozoicomonas acroporae]|uniref:sulfur carrier protein ThiS n=1 Tax=Endozoicomonas TaxID=305899 RepID=UPI000C77629B|nr:MULTISPECIES: sulfur carrier protein ThiS [Endozoicomonas]WBA80328.1 sulfur carrier protein ThiS [Endozoicomonas sp. GU-1]WBA87897.1 sulfur carrier protein ThiS [Endozoicomonas sp. GU-1]